MAPLRPAAHLRPVHGEAPGKTKEQVVESPCGFATKVGALISKEHFERVSGYLELARKEGGKFLAGGGRPKGISGGSSSSRPSSTGVNGQCRMVKEEVFGPVVTVEPFGSRKKR